MTQAQFEALIRQALTAGGILVTSNGYMTAGQVETAIGAICVLASLGWSMWTNRKVGIVQQAAKLTDVEHIEVRTHSLAAKVPSTKVTT